MASPHDDPEEFTGATQATKADPKGKPVKAAPVKRTPLAEEVASPVLSVAIYNPPGPDDAHPKFSRLAVAQRLDAAEAGLNTAQLEVTASSNHLRACEREEADALNALVKIMPGPTFDQVNRQRLSAEQAEKIRRVQAGESPIPPKVPTHGRSLVDIAAANRPRPSPQAANAPLRSPISRRTV